MMLYDQYKNNIPIITNLDFDNVVVRGVLSHLTEVVPGIGPFLVKMDGMADAFISKNTVAVVLLPEELDDEENEILSNISSQVDKYNLPVLALAWENDLTIIKKAISEEWLVFCGDRSDLANCKLKTGLYLSRFAKRSRKTILLVDDSGEVLRTVKSWLERKYDIIMTKSGEMAFRYLMKKIPDLILLDYEMPGMNGREVFERLKAEFTTADIPVFFLTGKNDRDIVLEIMSVHPEGYILKSESKEKVLARIDELFAKKK